MHSSKILVYHWFWVAWRPTHVVQWVRDLQGDFWISRLKKDAWTKKSGWNQFWKAHFKLPCKCQRKLVTNRQIFWATWSKWFTSETNAKSTEPYDSSKKHCSKKEPRSFILVILKVMLTTGAKLEWLALELHSKLVNLKKTRWSSTARATLSPRVEVSQPLSLPFSTLSSVTTSWQCDTPHKLRRCTTLPILKDQRWQQRSRKKASNWSWTEPLLRAFALCMIKSIVSKSSWSLKMTKTPSLSPSCSSKTPKWGPWMIRFPNLWCKCRTTRKPQSEIVLQIGLPAYSSN